MVRSITFRRSLLANLMLVIVLLSGAIILTTFVGSRAAVRTLARSLISRTMDRARLRLERFFDPVVRQLALTRAWGEAGLLDLDDPGTLDRLLAPLLEESPQISSVAVADERGREHRLLRSGGRWLRRQTRPDEWGRRARILEWGEGGGEPTATEREIEYDPRERPWYRGAVGAGARVFWTEPHATDGTREPGITASTAFTGKDGRGHVVGLEVRLRGVSAFTTEAAAGEAGVLFVVTGDGRVVGLPADPRFEDPAARRAALLGRPEELGVPVVADAVRAFESWPAGRRKPARFRSGGEAFWVQARRFPLSPDRIFRIAVAVPESELLGGLRQERTWIVLITLGVLLVAVLQAVALSRLYGRPLEALARQSDRISQGRLKPGGKPHSSVREVQRLAEAHDRMRESLRNLLRLEGDLKLARQIQQSTFPERLPELEGFEIDAWSEPAEETGGDTYDVVARPADPADRPRGKETGRAVLLLADATGHGVGPALSVTQVRAMLRMAVRMGGGLREIAENLNDQLCADLHGGRFITAWLGELDAGKGTLTSFSAGQAPILRYRAAEDDFDVLRADTIPFGIEPETEIRIADAIPLGAGDVVAVISDGVLEARNPERRQFGADRAMAVIRTHRRESPYGIVLALREAVAEFTEGAPPGDDRTVIVIKRTN